MGPGRKQEVAARALERAQRELLQGRVDEARRALDTWAARQVEAEAALAAFDVEHPKPSPEAKEGQ